MVWQHADDMQSHSCTWQPSDSSLLALHPADRPSHATWHLPLPVMPSDGSGQHTQSDSHPLVTAATGMPTEIHGFAASVFLRMPLLRHLMAWMGVHSGAHLNKRWSVCQSGSVSRDTCRAEDPHARDGQP